MPVRSIWISPVPIEYAYPIVQGLGFEGHETLISVTLQDRQKKEIILFPAAH